MMERLLETRGHTTVDGILQLELNLGIADVDVAVTVRVISKIATEVDANGWPIGFFEQVAGSMPDLDRGFQGEFEERMPLA